MLETPHVVVGAAIAARLGNPILAIPLAFASHFILDMVPHWNPSTYTETLKLGKPSNKSTILATIDSSLALITGSLIAASVLPNFSLAITILLSSLAAVISDLVKFPFFYFKKRGGLVKKWVDFERSFQIETDNFYLGMLTQIVITFAGLWWILQ